MAISIRHQCKKTCLLDGRRQLTLISGFGAGVARRHDLTAFSYEAFEDFKWFEGTIRYDHTHASWQLFESPASNVQWLDIEWTKDWEADTSQITYTNVKAGSEEFGSYITYGIVDDSDYDAFYTLSAATNEVNIKYNTETKAGRVKSPATAR